MSQARVIRRTVVWGGLALTVAGSVWTALQRDLDEQDAMPVRPADALTRTRALVKPADSEDASFKVVLRSGVRRVSSELRGDVDPFAIRSWLTAPPPPVPRPLPPSLPDPTAPALPFVYVGRQEQSDAAAPTLFYFTRGADLFVVVPGESLGDDYRFDGWEQESLRFTYLPLSVKQELTLGRNP